MESNEARQSNDTNDTNDAVSAKKVSLKQRFDKVRRMKDSAIQQADVTTAAISARAPVARPGLMFGNVIVADSDPRDNLLEFDRDASDPYIVTNMDPDDPIGFPSDIIPTDPFIA